MLVSEWWRLLNFNSPSMCLVDLCSSKPWFSQELLGAVLLLESQWGVSIFFLLSLLSGVCVWKLGVTEAFLVVNMVDTHVQPGEKLRNYAIQKGTKWIPLLISMFSNLEFGPLLSFHFPWFSPLLLLQLLNFLLHFLLLGTDFFNHWLCIAELLLRNRQKHSIPRVPISPTWHSSECWLVSQKVLQGAVGEALWLDTVPLEIQDVSHSPCTTWHNVGILNSTGNSPKPVWCHMIKALVGDETQGTIHHQLKAPGGLLP